jgi:carbamoylphosphate synthase large subunit
MTPAKVLVLSVGSGVGYGIVAALRLSSRPFVIVGLNSVAPAAGLFECDIAYLTPPTSEPDRFTERLHEIVRAERPTMVIPGRDADLTPLAAARPVLESLGAFALTGSVEAAAICTDKGRQAETLRDAGIRFARTAIDAAAAWRLAAHVGFPLIAKPRAGHGSIGIRLIHDDRDLHAALAQPNPPMIQEYLEPDEWHRDGDTLPRRLEPDGSLRQEAEYSIQLLLGREGRLLGTFASRNRLERGAPMLVEVVDDEALERLAADVAHALGCRGLVGPCNVQARRVGGRYVVFEVNARFTGLTPIRARMGFNEVEAAFRYFVDGALPESFLTFDKRQVAVRYLTESVFSTEARDELERRGRWRRSS